MTKRTHAKLVGLAASIDPLIHHPHRLALLSALARTGPLTFVELKEIVGTSHGNLSVHARKLELAEYVEANRAFEGRVPRTTYWLTNRGRTALERYLASMEAVIAVTRCGLAAEEAPCA